jgi:hypothetical protein
MDNYRHIQVFCEGPTEESFLESVVLPYLYLRFPYMPRPKITNFGGVGRTENIGYGRVKKHVVAEILSYVNKERKTVRKAFFTTFIDYYGFPKVNIPNYIFTELPDTYQMVNERQQALKRAILEEPELIAVQNKFVFEPFLMLHETETFVFVNPEKLYGIATTRKAIIKELVDHARHSTYSEINSTFQIN